MYLKWTSRDSMGMWVKEAQRTTNEYLRRIYPASPLRFLLKIKNVFPTPSSSRVSHPFSTARECHGDSAESKWPAGIMKGKIPALNIPFRIASASVIRTQLHGYRGNFILSLPSIIAHMLGSRWMEAMTAMWTGDGAEWKQRHVATRYEMGMQSSKTSLTSLYTKYMWWNDEHFANISSRS